ncbi:MAG: RagB/SusD family nutrient uptake outer membrane protein, partial [Desulfobacterales bacterium]|nr:RagB/SusD family nutrient uptake outer membrane protein [Desulfobacterales bacterium]
QYLKESTLGQYNGTPYAFLPMASDLSLIVGFSNSSNTHTGGNNVPTWEMIGSYEEGDARLDASVGIAEGVGEAQDFIIESIHSPVGYTKPEDKEANPYIKKWVHAHTEKNKTDDNFIIYRYAEVLLFIAECLNELNRPGEALTYLNLVRNRAGLENITETSQSALRDIIAHERRVELAFENKRWLDLVRTEKAIEVMTANRDYIYANYGKGGYLLPNGYQLAEWKLILPIPEREIIVSELEQNPNYE